MKNYSQSGQDIFTYYICNTNNGYFLDFGCSDPIFLNNTYLLELNGWNGLMIDIDYESIMNCKKIRKSDSFLVDLKNIIIDKKELKLIEFLKKYNCPKIIDYISFDVDEDTLNIMNKFPFNKYEFKCMTFEHDSYRVGNELKNYSRKIFTNFGYKLICSDVKSGNNAFEDWYINPNYINENKYKNIICDNTEWVDIIKKINMLNE